MRICLNFDPSRLLRWHCWLAQALAAMPGNNVSCSFASHRHPLPSGSQLLLQLERLTYGFRGQGAMDPVESALLALPRQQTELADVTIDVSGAGTPTAGRRMLVPLFNGVPGEIGVMAALTNDEDLVVDLQDTAYPSRSWTARPASEDRRVFTPSLDAALSCAITLILKALRDDAAPPDIGGISHTKPGAHSFGTASVLAFATATFTTKTARLLNKVARGGQTWAIGWRFDQSASLLDRRETAFRVLSGGSSSYLADPFPFQHRGQDFIFVEQYLYAKNRGCIAVVALDRDGATSSPRIVLEEPYHLSYPFVFEHAGEIWMIPESGAARSVNLYRAVEFPYRWTREACLIDDIEGYDATPLNHNGSFWLFVSPRLWKSSSWDILDLYRADSLTSPWMPRAADPVLIDARLSRPAGAIIKQRGCMIRPAQDCSRGYGGAVTFCRIDAIGTPDFVQTPIGRIESGSFGCHTYNRRGGLEVIDIFGHVRGVREAAVSYVPLASDTRTSGPLEQTRFGAGLGIRLAARS